MDTKHTPTPWRYRNTPGAGLEIVGDFEGKERLLWCEVWHQFPNSRWDEMQAANAAFIVRAVNSHDQLVAALRHMTTEYIRTRAQQDGKKIGEDWSGYESIVCVEAARAALTAARA